MLFNSYQFLLLFLPTVLLLVGLIRWLNRPQYLVPLLSIASFGFYAYWDPRYVALLAGSIVFNYLIGIILTGMMDHRPRRTLLAAGVVGNLVLLGYFKYVGFFVGSANALFGTELDVIRLALPLGISFFTFTQIEYLVDAYRRKAPVYPVAEYVLFVTFFPHLIAGPILRHHEVIPQFESDLRGALPDTALASGFLFLAIGIFKKVVIADSLAVWVNTAFAGWTLSLIDSWMGALAYTFQLYFDFSGYSDMAVGIALMLNITIPYNFNSPYKSATIGDFWRRWHMSLSTFLREYLYFPLGGSRRGRARTLLNLIITMLLGGLWHGAGWTFVLWGGWHGVLLAVDHAWRWTGRELKPMVTRPLTFVAVVVGWVVFRSPSIATAHAYLDAMAGRNGVVLPASLSGALSPLAAYGVRFGPLIGVPEGGFGHRLALLAMLVAFVSLLPNTQELAARMRPQARWAVFAAALFITAFLLTGQVTEFLYYQF
jgi:alginate O-acetyltransferase complex protein AlgI